MRSSSANTIDLCSRVLTFGNDLLHGDLVPSDGEALANEIPASMTGSGGAAATSRTGPGAHQLAAGIEELPHGAEATGGVFVTSITHTHTEGHAHRHASEQLAPSTASTVTQWSRRVHPTNQTSYLASSLLPLTKHALMHLPATMMLRQISLSSPLCLCEANFPLACQRKPVGDGWSACE